MKIVAQNSKCRLYGSVVKWLFKPAKIIVAFTYTIMRPSYNKTSNNSNYG